MRKIDVVNTIIPADKFKIYQDSASAYAPANIALCKYWGKRDEDLNLPFNSSLSISLGTKGTATKIIYHQQKNFDVVILNGKEVDPATDFAKKISEFINLFRQQRQDYFIIDTVSTIPIAAGLASSASGFAALTKALNTIYNWQFEGPALSILARLGSGSACRSLWHGFVEWSAGTRQDGMDSYAHKLTEQWPELRLGLLILNEKEKLISSRTAMAQTVNTSSIYQTWLSKAQHDINVIKQAIIQRDFLSLGETAESNAIAMHATMKSAWPPISFTLPETHAAMTQVLELRQRGLNVFFTQDAGPNLKILFLEKDTAVIQATFPNIEIVAPFA